MSAFQKTPSFGSIPGFVTFFLGVVLMMFIANQWGPTQELASGKVPSKLGA